MIHFVDDAIDKTLTSILKSKEVVREFKASSLISLNCIKADICLIHLDELTSYVRSTITYLENGGE